MEKTKDKVSCAYKEIYEILKIFPKELVDRIPKYKLDYIKQTWMKVMNIILLKKLLMERQC